MVPGVWQQARELLTPDTAKKIIRPQLRSRQPTECGKHFVAGMVPVPIVDALKAIEIKHDEGRRLARKTCPLQQPFARLEESATVGDASLMDQSRRPADSVRQSDPWRGLRTDMLCTCRQMRLRRLQRLANRRQKDRDGSMPRQAECGLEWRPHGQGAAL